MMLSLRAVARVLGVDHATALRRLIAHDVPVTHRGTGDGKRYEVALSDLRRAFPHIGDEANELRMTIDVFRKQLAAAVDRIEALEAQASRRKSA